MLGWLKYYNLCDVQPFSLAIENSFRQFNKYFGVSPLTHLSLPSMAQKAMFMNFEINSPLVYTFSKSFLEINKAFRENCLGGLTNVYRRHCMTGYDSKYPKAAMFTDSGKKFSAILSLDFNRRDFNKISDFLKLFENQYELPGSMYLHVQRENLPTTPGIFWEKFDGGFRKKIMSVMAIKNINS